MKMLSRVVILPRPSFKPLTESCGKLALGDIIIKNFCVRNSKSPMIITYFPDIWPCKQNVYQVSSQQSKVSFTLKRKERWVGQMYWLLQKKSCVKAIYLIPSRRPAKDFSKCSLDSGRWTVEASHFLEVLIIWKETTYYSRAKSLAPPEDLNSEHCWTRAKRREATTHWMMVVAGVCM